MMKQLLILISFLLVSVVTQAQNKVEMAFDLRSSGKIYVVVLVMLTIFAGVAFFLFSIEGRVRKLEKNQKKQIQK